MHVRLNVPFAKMNESSIGGASFAGIEVVAPSRAGRLRYNGHGDLSSRRAFGGPASHTTVRTGHVHGGSREVKTQLSRSRTALVGRFEREKAELDEVVVGERLL